MIRKFRERYRAGIVVTAVFVLFIAFITPNSLIDAIRIGRNIDRMESERIYYHRRAKEDSTFLQNLKDNEFLEKYAREVFYMKRAGEEIYLVDD